MGLSTKQVPSDHPLEWSQTLVVSGTMELPKPPTNKRQQQNHQQQSVPLKCPRCGSTNTKFCYYNNYNKSQPRHFCKGCKRHWTRGGTLRNVPVGGGRKNKRLKTANPATTTTTTTAIGSSSKNYSSLSHFQKDCHNSPLAGLTNQENISDILYQALISNSSSVQSGSINAFTSKTFTSNAIASDQMLSSLPQDRRSLQFSFTGLSPFDTIPCSLFPSSNPCHNNAYDYTAEIDHVDSSTITTVTDPTASGTGVFSESWKGPTTGTSTVMAEMPNYWNWNDMDPLISADLNLSWDNIGIKP
ncbi:hypothetical protein ACH5RR_017851 [Cinchona calisaya]|uniref:Dof zinc finger protein n=1 Tax=Cinchona calisaya TaxID=153742 RepID=A0ABD2ZJS6_9GENT